MFSLFLEFFNISPWKKNYLFLIKLLYLSKKNKKFQIKNQFLAKLFKILVKPLSLEKTNNVSWLNFYLSSKPLYLLVKLLLFDKFFTLFLAKPLFFRQK
jgi:hypothetical protein